MRPIQLWIIEDDLSKDQHKAIRLAQRRFEFSRGLKTYSKPGVNTAVRNKTTREIGLFFGWNMLEPSGHRGESPFGYVVVMFADRSEVMNPSAFSRDFKVIGKVKAW
jgi:hypothetical protein